MIWTTGSMNALGLGHLADIMDQGEQAVAELPAPPADFQKQLDAFTAAGGTYTRDSKTGQYSFKVNPQPIMPAPRRPEDIENYRDRQAQNREALGEGFGAMTLMPNKPRRTPLAAQKRAREAQLQASDNSTSSNPVPMALAGIAAGLILTRIL